MNFEIKKIEQGSNRSISFWNFLRQVYLPTKSPQLPADDNGKHAPNALMHKLDFSHIPQYNQVLMVALKLYLEGICSLLLTSLNPLSLILGKFGTRYSRMDQVKFVEDSF